MATDWAPHAELPRAGALAKPPARPRGLVAGTHASLWAGREAEHAPILRFLAPRQRVELSPEDGLELGIATGDDVEVSRGGDSVRGVAALRDGLPRGSVYLVEVAGDDGAHVLANGAAQAVEVKKVGDRVPAGTSL